MPFGATKCVHTQRVGVSCEPPSGAPEMGPSAALLPVDTLLHLQMCWMLCICSFQHIWTWLKPQTWLFQYQEIFSVVKIFLPKFDPFLLFFAFFPFSPKATPDNCAFLKLTSRTIWNYWWAVTMYTAINLPSWYVCGLVRTICGQGCFSPILKARFGTLSVIYVSLFQWI